MTGNAGKPIVFDFFGTLFDISGMAPKIEKILHSIDGPSFLDLWRRKQLEYSYLMTVMGDYETFFSITGRALKYSLNRFGLQQEEYGKLMSLWLEPELYADVSPALGQLSGKSLSILSNGDPEMLQRGLEHCGAGGMFSHVLSVHQARVFKPHRKAYSIAASVLGVEGPGIMFVSSNGWDIAGASGFGFETVWLNRAGLPVEELKFRPSHIINNLNGLKELR